MSLILKQVITGPAAWKGADIVGDTSWVHPLSGEVIATLDAALAHVKARGLTFPNFGREDFPIGDWVHDLKAHSDELENGRGFLVLRGLPIERYSEEDIHIIYYGIGLHMGVPVRQNPKGDLLGLVMNVRCHEENHSRLRDQPVFALPLGPVGRGGSLVYSQGQAGGLEFSGECGGDLQRDFAKAPRVPGPVLPHVVFFAPVRRPAQPVTDLQSP